MQIKKLLSNNLIPMLCRMAVSTRKYKLLFAAIAALFCGSIYERMPQVDEGVIAEHCYHFGREGYVKSFLHGGYMDGGADGWRQRQFFYHKLFVLTGTLFMKACGFNIYSFKCVSLLFTLLFFVLLYYCCRKLAMPPPVFWCAAALLLWNAQFYGFAFLFRPEIMCMCLGFASFLMLQNSWHPAWQALLAGMFAGLAAFSHLNGMVFSMAGMALLLCQRRFRMLLPFALSAGLFSLCYFFDTLSIAELKEWLRQISIDPNVASKCPWYLMPYTEQKRLLHNADGTTFTLVFLFALIVNFKFLKEKFSAVMLYLLFLMVGMGCFAHSATAKYGLLYFPYIAILTAVGYRRIFHGGTKKLKIAAIAVLLPFVVCNGILNFGTTFTKIDIAAHNAALSALLPRHDVPIRASTSFVFGEIYNYPAISGDIAFTMSGQPKTLENYLRFAASYGDRYVLIDKASAGTISTDIADSSAIEQGGICMGYRLIYHSPACYLFEYQ
jgi:hypothetical protein